MTKKTVKKIEDSGIIEGIYENVEIVPELSKREMRLETIIKAVSENKFYVLPIGFSKNTLYLLLKTLKEKNVSVAYGKTKNSDGNTQFVIFKKSQ